MNENVPAVIGSALPVVPVSRRVISMPNPLVSTETRAAIEHVQRFDPSRLGVYLRLVAALPVLIALSVLVAPEAHEGVAVISLVVAWFAVFIGGTVRSDLLTSRIEGRHRLSLIAPTDCADAYDTFIEQAALLRHLNVPVATVAEMGHAQVAMENLLVAAADLHQDGRVDEEALIEVRDQMIRLAAEATTLSTNAVLIFSDSPARAAIESAQTLTFGSADTTS